MTDLEPAQALGYDRKRMKIVIVERPEKFAGMERMMNKRQELLEQVLALALLAYAMALWVGERLRDVLFGGAEGAVLEDQAKLLPPRRGKWRRYCSAFVWLKGNLVASDGELRTGCRTGRGVFCLHCHAWCPNSCLNFRNQDLTTPHKRLIINHIN